MYYVDTYLHDILTILVHIKFVIMYLLIIHIMDCDFETDVPLRFSHSKSRSAASLWLVKIGCWLVNFFFYAWLIASRFSDYLVIKRLSMQHSVVDHFSITRRLQSLPHGRQPHPNNRSSLIISKYKKVISYILCSVFLLWPPVAINGCLSLSLVLLEVAWC